MGDSSKGGFQMFKSKLYLVSASIIILTLVTGGCAKSESEPTSVPTETSSETETAAETATLDGTLNVYVTDAPGRDEVTSIMVSVAEIKVHQATAEQEQEQQQEQSGTPEQEQEQEQGAGTGKWITINIDANEATFDLLDIVGVEQFLGTSEVAAGKYTQVRLVVDTIQVALGDGELQDATVSSNELKIVRSFDITAGETTTILLDFDADRMVTVTGASNIKVKPVIKLSIKHFDAKGEPKKTADDEVVEEMVEEEGEEPPEEEPPVEEEEEEEHPEDVEMTITSTAFQDGETIPTRYSCDGEDISPALSWSGAPEGTQSFVIILDDPDAPGGTFNHWVIFNIPASTTELGEAVPTTPELASGARQGTTSFGTIGYGGPCPPLGTEHHYHFILYAIDQTLDLSAGATKTQVLNAIEGHILGQTEIVGLYQSP